MITLSVYNPLNANVNEAESILEVDDIADVAIIFLMEHQHHLF